MYFHIHIETNSNKLKLVLISNFLRSSSSKTKMNKHHNRRYVNTRKYKKQNSSHEKNNFAKVFKNLTRNLKIMLLDQTK